MNVIKLWKLTQIISLQNEPYLEKWARLFRYETALPVIKKQLRCQSRIKLLDVGCGQDTLFYEYIKYKFPDEIHKIEYVGLDPLISRNKTSQKIIKKTYEEHFKSTNEKYDLITLFAVLEHVDDPTDLLLVLSKLLNKKGYVVGTTPGYPAKPVLEFLSYQLNIIAKREIEEHKNYFNKDSIEKIFNTIEKKVGNFYFYHQYFEFGLNNLFVIANI